MTDPRFALLAALVIAAAPLPREGTTRVQVGGATYRVTVKGGAVVVARKALVVKYDVGERDKQREAVKLATGCMVVDELPGSDARLRGKLDCRPLNNG